jgi:hypothetical protein
MKIPTGKFHSRETKTALAFWSVLD